MKKELKDYLHLYLGCKILRPDMRTQLTMSGISGDIIHFLEEGRGETYGTVSLAKPILRPLSDMTVDEAVQLIEIGTSVYNFISIRKVDRYEVMYDGGYPTSKRTWLYHLRFSELKAEQFHFLLSKNFDLFELIEAGLAIDKTGM
jgi:hypothetical protein